MLSAQPYETYKSKRDGLDTIPDGAILFHDITNNKLNASFKINDFRDTQFHRNNGVTNLKETRRIEDSPFPLWQTGSNDIRTPYGFLQLQHLVTAAYGFLIGSQAGKPLDVQSGFVFMRATDELSLIHI